MSDERDPKDEEKPTEELKKGLGHLWRAAKGAAASVKKEVDRTEFGKAFEEAGRELGRAANNVVGRISTEIAKSTEKGKDEAPPAPPPPPPVGEDDDFDGVRPRDAKPADDGAKPKGPTPEDPGFRIAVDDEKKPR